MSDYLQGIMPNPEIFISYAWEGESEEIANALEYTFQEKGIKIVRDKTDLGYKGLIREFMQQIGEGKCVITVISDKYLKSKNCMFELLEIAKNNNFYDRIFPIVLKDAKIYDALERLEYINYWGEKVEELNEAMKGVKVLANLKGITDEIDLYTNIRNKIAELTDILQNMNSLTVEMHREADFGQIIAAIEQRLNSEAQETLKQTIPKAGVDRLKLRRTLKSIILDQFNELIDVLDVPSGIIPPSQTEQASRVEALLNWAKSPSGCGLERVQQVLEEIINPQ
jgi:hypothetical protein